MTISNFIEELSKLGITLDDDRLAKLERYYELLIEWNKKINLTRIVEKEDVYLKHFYDSLTLIKAIDLNNVNSLCDIGTGAGFPGLVIKIVFPNINITLVDALNKRINFLNEVIKELNLDKINTIHARAEEYGKTNRELYDVVVARAVANISTLLEYSIPLVKINGVFIAMKGTNEEISTLKTIYQKLDIKLESNIEFLLPYENSNRSLITFRKLSKTNSKYPRKNSEIQNNPLI